MTSAIDGGTANTRHRLAVLTSADLRMSSSSFSRTCTAQHSTAQHSTARQGQQQHMLVVTKYGCSHAFCCDSSAATTVLRCA